MSVAEIEEGVFESTATIDNGSFGTRTIRFETGRLAQQAAGAVVAYLDDETMLLSATTASKSPKEHFDFFPLTVDVEERMYAAGRIPGSFFRREGRPSTDAILTCRLIDRPLRPSFVKGLRNEIQVVVTILSLDPNDLYDVLAINAASASTQICRPAVLRPHRRRAGRADRRPVGRLPDRRAARAGRVRHGRGGPQGRRPRRRRDHDGRGRGHREGHRADRGRRHALRPKSVVAEGLEAAKPFIAALCAAQQELADAAAKPVGDFPVFLDYQDDVFYAVASVATDELAAALTIARQGRSATRAPTSSRPRSLERLGRHLRGAGEGDQRGLPLADQEAGPPAHPDRPVPHRRPRHHRHPRAVGRGRGASRGRTAARCSSAARPRSWA